MAAVSELNSDDARVLLNVLEKMRARDGLTLARLRDSKSDVSAPLLELSATR